MDFPTPNLTPEPPNLSFPPLDKCNLIHHSHCPGEYPLDNQRTSERMEERQDPDGGSGDEVPRGGIYGACVESDGFLGTE